MSDIFAKTLYGEAEAWNEDDAKAIASVVMNRVRLQNWPDTIDDVCLQPWAFSCWNEAYRYRLEDPYDKAWFERCKAIAAAAARSRFPDPTRRATHYYANYISAPSWVKDKETGAVIKFPVYTVKHRKGSAHLFYNNIDTPAPPLPEVFTKPRPPASVPEVSLNPNPPSFFERVFLFLKGVFT